MNIIGLKKTDIHLYSEDGRDVWCNQGSDGFYYDKKGNRFAIVRYNLFQAATGDFLYAA